jgi:hypothetical protein
VHLPQLGGAHAAANPHEVRDMARPHKSFPPVKAASVGGVTFSKHMLTVQAEFRTSSMNCGIQAGFQVESGWGRPKLASFVQILNEQGSWRTMRSRSRG